MRILFASQNRHKLTEMSSLMIPHEIILPSDIGITFDFEEIETTFMGNALGKANHLYELTGHISLADDSGIVIDALDGAPGAYSARYGTDVFNRTLDANEKNQYVLQQLQGIPHARRTARFVCSIALVLDTYRRFVVQETVEGYIAERPYGAGGFGYDPIFIVGNTGKTMAELSSKEKNLISHRAIAAKRIVSIMKQLEETEVVHVC